METKKAEFRVHHAVFVEARFQKVTSEPQPCGNTQISRNGLIYKRELDGSKHEPLFKQLYLILALSDSFISSSDDQQAGENSVNWDQERQRTASIYIMLLIELERKEIVQYRRAIYLFTSIVPFPNFAGVKGWGWFGGLK